MEGGRGGQCYVFLCCVVVQIVAWAFQVFFFFGGGCGSFLDEEKGKETKRIKERREKRAKSERKGGREGTFNVWPEKRVNGDSGWKDCDSEEREEKKCYAMRKRERGNRFVVVLKLECDACFG